MSTKKFQSQSNVRSICVIAHVDHGKTSYCDSLLSANNIISSRLAGSLRYLDSREDEVERGITMESSAVSLGFKMLKKTKEGEVVPQDFMINLIDTPGHVDFSSEVSTASRLCDGALVLVDSVEGVCTQTITVLRQAWLDKLRPILVINKLDRLITELKLSPSEAYHHLSQLIEGVNAIMGGFYASDRMEDDLRWREAREKRMEARREAEAGEIEAGAGADDEEEGHEFEEKDDEDIYFAPERGNVIFASAIDGWAFRVGKFAQLYAEKLKISEPKLRRVLWGDFYLDPKTKRVVSHRKLAGRSLKPMFVQFVLENIWRVYEATMLNHNSDKIDKIVASLGVKLHPRDLRTKDHRTLLNLIMSQWLPLSTTTFQTVVEIIPPPQIAQAIRVPKMLHPDSYSNASSQLPTSKLERDLYSCDPSEESNVVVYVSKMFAIKKSELPENRVRLVTAEDMREQGRIQRERRAEERRLEIELDREGLIGMGADGKSAAAGQKVGPNGVPIPKEDEDETPTLTFVSGAQPVKATEPEPTPEPSSDDSTSDEALIGFARLYSGTLKLNTTLHCLLPKYDTTLSPSHPRNLKYITSVKLTSLYMMMGRDLVAVDTVPAGNVFAVGGLEGKVWRNATLCALSSKGATGKEDPEELKAGLVNLAGVIMTSPPIVRVALEPKNPADLPKLVEGLRLLNQADPCVETLVQETGEHVILTAGELHLERCLKDLRERFAKIEIQASKPIVPFRETAVKGVDMAPTKTKDAPRGTILGSTTNSLVNFTIRAVPLPLKITSFLQANTSTMRRIQSDRRGARVSVEDDDSSLDQVASKQLTTAGGGDEDGAKEVKPEEFWPALEKICEECGRDWVGMAERIWAFGPKRVGPNLLIDRPNGTVKSLRQRYEASIEPSSTGEASTVDASTPSADAPPPDHDDQARMLRDFDDSIENGFQIATFQGPLCGEPVVGMAYFVEKVDVGTSEDRDDLRSKLAQATGSLISAVKDACRAGLLDWSPRIMLAMYTSDIQTSTEVLGKVYGVVARRSGKIVSEEMKEGTSFFTIRALLPVIESFGFADEIRKRSSGAASPQLVFSGYEMLDQDPYWVPTTVEELEDLGTLAERANVAKVYVDGVRKRKGMFVEQKIVAFAEKQRTRKF